MVGRIPRPRPLGAHSRTDMAAAFRRAACCRFARGAKPSIGHPGTLREPCRHLHPCCAPRSGLTLIELLVVAAVIGLIVLLILPAIQSAREAARRTQCSDHLRQIGMGLEAHHTLHGAFPVGCLGKRRRGSTAAVQLAWSAFLLPFVDQQLLWLRLSTERGYDDPQNNWATSAVIPLYLCPSTTRMDPDRTRYRTRDGLGAIDYGGMFGSQTTSPVMNGTMIYERAIRIADIRDGTSKTILIAEDTGRGASTNGQWANGENIFDQGNQINLHRDNEIWSDHPSGAQILLADGSVQFLHQTIGAGALAALCTRAGEEPIGASDWR